jgi:hypothetical protein
MNDQLLLVIVGAILPPFIDLVNRFVKQSHWRFIISLVFSLVVGGVIAFLQFGWDELLANGGLIFASAQTVYKLWYEKSSWQRTIRG